MSRAAELRAADAANTAFLSRHCAQVADDLALKRRLMAGSAFAFLRASCPRFAGRLPLVCPEVLDATPAPAVGDAHLENFGTWRDAEGRLVWGINDLDEAAVLPWTIDLLRLMTSALLCPGAARPRAIEAALLEGYAAGLLQPSPFILDERHATLRDMAAPPPAERARFWRRIDRLEEAEPPPALRGALLAALPDGAAEPRFATRVAGLGSLGRPRLVAIADWCGGRVVREAKARLPSAWIEAGLPGAKPVDLQALAAHPWRAPDPWFRADAVVVVRRLAPDSRKLEWPAAKLHAQLDAMGRELANIHASGGDAHRLLRDLAARPSGWLRAAAKRMAADQSADHAAWQRIIR
jgi:hypothetical protein